MNTLNAKTHHPVRIALAAAALISAVATGARAADVPEVHVKYADLNLNTPGGAATLYRRIEAAARQVCGQPDNRDLAKLDATKACADQAIAAAVALVNNPILKGIQEDKGVRTPAASLAAMQ